MAQQLAKKLAHPKPPPQRRQATSEDTDRLRARALRGDRLDELRDSRREWIWRSLLKGTRLEVARTLAGLTEEQTIAAVARVRHWYQQRLAEYKRQPRIRKPVTRPTQSIPAIPAIPAVSMPQAPSSSAPHARPRRGWWPFAQ